MSQPAISPWAQGRARIPRIPDAAVLRARLAVVPRTRVRAPRVPFVVLVSLILVGGIVGLLLFNTSMQQASFDATRLEDQADTLAARQQGLERELEALNSSQRLGVIAQNQLHMVQAGPPAFLSLDGTVTGTPTAAVAGNRVRLEDAAPPVPAAVVPQVTTVVVPSPLDAAPDATTVTSPDATAGAPAGTSAGTPADSPADTGTASAADAG